MNYLELLNKYKAFLIGFGGILIAFAILQVSGFVSINFNSKGEVALIYVFWSLLVSFIIHYFHAIIKWKSIFFRIGGIILLLSLMIAVFENLENTNVNLLAILSAVITCSVLYLAIPKFFVKHLYLLLATYGIILVFVILQNGQNPTPSDPGDHVIALFFGPIPIIICIWIYDQWKWLKTLRSEKSKAELELLKSQINPHFFFNTLNNLYGLAVEKSDKTPEVILKLSDVMRYTIYNGKEEFVDLKEEVEHLENYMELHKIRFKEDVDFVFSKHLEMDYKIAPLLLIILLENALKHGAESKTEGAYIHIDLLANKGGIRFSVENNFEPTQNNQQAGGIGLDNLRKRLALIYPKKNSLFCSSEANIFTAVLEIKNS